MAEEKRRICRERKGDSIGVLVQCHQQLSSSWVIELEKIAGKCLTQTDGCRIKLYIIEIRKIYRVGKCVVSDVTLVRHGKT